MDEDTGCNQIPVSNIKSNNIKNGEKYFQLFGQMKQESLNQQEIERPLSPGAGMCMRDHDFKQ